MGYLSLHPEIKEATPAMPTTVLQTVRLKSACLQCERVARAFAICQISSLFIGSLGGLRFRGLLAPLS